MKMTSLLFCLLASSSAFAATDFTISPKSAIGRKSTAYLQNCREARKAADLEIAAECEKLGATVVSTQYSVSLYGTEDKACQVFAKATCRGEL